MASVIKRGLRTFDAMNFIDRLKSVSGVVEHIMYVGLSRTTPWTDELLPPTPTDTKQAETDFWSEVVGFQRISPTQVTMVVPRINWANGATFVKFDVNAADAYQQRFYCVNSQYQVFIVDSITGNTATTTEPLFNASNGSALINTQDGYVWKFLYELSVSDINKTVKNDWLPVNVGDRRTSNQNAHGDKQAEVTLGARHVMLQAEITDQGIPLNVSYRQLGLILDPLTPTDTKLVSTTAIPSQVKTNSGTMTYLENRKEIKREVGQSESPSIILTF